jgi:hypothetical protein
MGKVAGMVVYCAVELEIYYCSCCQINDYIIFTLLLLLLLFLILLLLPLLPISLFILLFLLLLLLHYSLC